MSVWQSTKSFFGFSEEELDPLAVESGEAQLIEEPKSPQPVRSFKGSLISSKSTSNFAAATEIRVEEPRIYEDSLNIATSLRESKPVIVNLKYLDADAGKRLVDFVCGTAYAINGHMMKLGENIFLFTPASVLIADAASEQKSSLEQGLADEERQVFFKRAV